MRIMITGAAGYIGSVLSGTLLESGHSVVGLDSLLFGDHGVRHLRGAAGFELVEGDLRRPGDYAELLERCDAVVHLAAIVGDPACKKTPELAVETNRDAAFELFRRVQESAGVRRFLFASTCSNYGRNVALDACREDTALAPLSLYAQTKVEFEQHILTAPVRGDLIPTVARFATAYGLSPRMRFDLTVNEFTRDVALGRRLEIFGEQFWRPYCHTSDLARACEMILTAAPESVDHQVFNVGGTDENYTKKMIADLLVGLVPDAQIEYVHRDEDPRDYKVNFDKLASTLGFTPTSMVPAGIADILAAVRGGVFPDSDSDRFRNS